MTLSRILTHKPTHTAHHTQLSRRSYRFSPPGIERRAAFCCVYSSPNAVAYRLEERCSTHTKLARTTSIEHVSWVVVGVLLSCCSCCVGRRRVTWCSLFGFLFGRMHAEIHTNPNGVAFLVVWCWCCYMLHGARARNDVDVNMMMVAVRLGEVGWCGGCCVLNCCCVLCGAMGKEFSLAWVWGGLNVCA